MYGQDPETISLRLDGDFSFGTLGFVGTIENLGPQRNVLVTAGHVVDDAPSILIHGTDSKTYSAEVVQQFERFLGVSRFRLGEQDVLVQSPLTRYVSSNSKKSPVKYYNAPFHPSIVVA